MSAFIQQGQTALKARLYPTAVKAFEGALREDPANVQVMAWLGQSLYGVGRRVEAAAHLRQVGAKLLESARESGDIKAVLDVTAQLQQWSDFEGALEITRQAIEISPAQARGFQLLALTYSQLNRTAEALEAGQRALDLAPDHSMMQILQGSLEADAGKNVEARERLERILTTALNAREEFRTRKELARVLDKLKHFDQVFPHLHASARLAAALPEMTAQNTATLPKLIKENKSSFDSDLLGRWAGKIPPGEKAPVFILGFMRSGTTMTQEVLDAHPDVFVADEADLILATKRELDRMNMFNVSTAEKLRKLDLTGILHLRAFYWARVQDRFGDKIGQRLFIDKFTMNTVDLGFINVIFPDAKVIFAVRDPRDICVSCFMQLMVPSPTTVQFLSWTGTAAFYAQVMDWWLHIRGRLTLRFVEFRYEDAVMQFEPTFRRIFAFLELPWNPDVVKFHERASKKFIATPSRNQVAQPLYTSSVTRWRHYESEFPPIAGILQPFVTAFDYDSF